jgi:hypothetical protein
VRGDGLQLTPKNRSSDRVLGLPFEAFVAEALGRRAALEGRLTVLAHSRYWPLISLFTIALGSTSHILDRAVQLPPSSCKRRAVFRGQGAGPAPPAYGALVRVHPWRGRACALPAGLGRRGRAARTRLVYEHSLGREAEVASCMTTGRPPCFCHGVVDDDVVRAAVTGARCEATTWIRCRM